ncbi:DUF2752 domain-containing protein [Lachnoclostridium sp. Marseille-P6806]|uniref:DUF2752 domain-containing protein n=1 Tax=Lachnoclostridium sp. Marseille-P6806 TaxID=2364793 RepID=UPI0010311C43|nr:DUF2752 domain-containing protein [Lachnoclostridium sp. Marseille-P6806]
MKTAFRKFLNNIRKDAGAIALPAPLLLLWRALMLARFKASCPSVILTGFPCPACGLTRAALALLRGDFRTAWQMNPSLFLLVPFVFWCLYWRWWREERIRGFRPLLLALCIAAILLFAARMLRYFPRQAPYSFSYRSVTSHLIPDYNRRVSGYFPSP